MTKRSVLLGWAFVYFVLAISLSVGFALLNGWI